MTAKRFSRRARILVKASLAISSVSLALAALAFAGCSPGSSDAAKEAGADSALVTDSAKDAKDLAPDSGTHRVSVTVGAKGAALTSADGVVVVTIPPGALSDDMVITLVPAIGAPKGYVGTPYEILPEGTTFAVPAQISFSYDPGQLDGAPPDSLVVASASNGVWQPQPGNVTDTTGHRVSALTTHLSLWAIVPSAQDPCDCHVDAAATCCAKYEGTLTVATPALCQCVGVGIDDFTTCYAAKTADAGGGKIVNTFCDDCLGGCCRDGGGTVGDSCSCLLNSALDQVLKCSGGCFAKNSAPTVCSEPTGLVGVGDNEAADAGVDAPEPDAAACGATVTTDAILLTNDYQAVIGAGGYAYAYNDMLGSSSCADSLALCGLGTSAVANQATNVYGGGFGVTLNQAMGTNTPVEPYTPTGGGIAYAVTNLPAGTRLIIGNLDGNASNDGIDYCATLAGPNGTVPWASFNSECWDPDSGVTLTSPPAGAVHVNFEVPAGAVAQSWEFCVTALSFAP